LTELLCGNSNDNEDMKMWVIVGLAVLFVVFAIWKHVAGWYDELPMLGMMGCGGALFIIALTIPINRMSIQDALAQRDALQSTYNELRHEPLEMASVGKQVAQWNGNLASAQHWNRTQWRWWVPDAVQNTKPIH
jgi:hypothetical protein